MAEQNQAFNMAAVAANLPQGAPAVHGAAPPAGLSEEELEREQLMAALPPEVRPKVEALQEIQKEHDSIHEKFLEERAELERKYEQLYAPLYHRRYEVVNGSNEQTPAVDPSQAGAAEPAKGVPGFWLAAMKNNGLLAEQITARDEGALKYLQDIQSTRLIDAKGFKLDFYFAPNPYFRNAVLTKSYIMVDEDEPILEKAEGTVIEWHPGKNLTEKVFKKKPKKGTRSSKPITKTEPCDSFFNFFAPPAMPTEEDELDEEEAEELQEQMEDDYDIGSILKMKIIPAAVLWYTGEAADFEDMMEGDDEDEEEDEE